MYDTIKAKLTKYKWLEGGVKFVEEPRAGEILKRCFGDGGEIISSAPPQMLYFSAADRYKG